MVACYSTAPYFLRKLLLHVKSLLKKGVAVQRQQQQQRQQQRQLNEEVVRREHWILVVDFVER